MEGIFGRVLILMECWIKCGRMLQSKGSGLPINKEILTLRGSLLLLLLLRTCHLLSAFTYIMSSLTLWFLRSHLDNSREGIAHPPLLTIVTDEVHLCSRCDFSLIDSAEHILLVSGQGSSCGREQSHLSNKNSAPQELTTISS